MSSTPVEIGTLIAVILKAKNLPNKRHIGKQDPYCCVSLNGEKRRTRAIKRGGQHPEWDEEVRFSLLEDPDVERTANGKNTPPPLPPKNSKGPRKIKGGTSMKLQCFADDPREPDLIGETMVDLTEVLTKGETDEWFTIMNKDKYCGEVYLELTFWSNERPPERKVTPKPTKKNKQYAGPGTFVPSAEVPTSLLGGPGSHSSRISSISSPIDDRKDSIPASLRASNPSAKLELYSAPYEQRGHFSPIDRMANDFGELSVDHKRRESFPPPHGHTLRPSSSMGFSNLPTSHGFEPNVYPDGFQVGPVTVTQSQHRATVSGAPPPFVTQRPYQPRYETGAPPTSYTSQQPSTQQNGPRYSLPSPSGFATVPSAAPSGFLPMASHQPDLSSFSPPPTQTPMPMSYGAPQMHVQASFAPNPTQTPVPSGFMSPVQHSPSSPFHRSQSFTPQSQSSFQYPQYATQLPPSAPPQQYAPPAPQSTPPQHYASQQQYAPPQPPASVPPQSHSAPPQTYSNYIPNTPSPPHDYVPPPPPLHNNPLSSSQGPGSRPLPQQPQTYGQQPVQHQSAPALAPSPQSYSPSQSGPVTFPPTNGYNSAPPPPPAPPQFAHERTTSLSYHQPANPVPPPPPPPPLSQFQSSSPSGRPGLPQPPVNYHQQQQPIYQPIPPPPPPPDLVQHLQNHPPPPPPLQSNPAQPYYPGPPPQSQWVSQGQPNGNYS